MKVKRSHDSSGKHKHKKTKKHKRHREATSSSGDSNSDNSGMEWVEAPAPKVVPSQNKREDWMNEELFVSTLTKEEMKSGSSSRERKKMAAIQQQEKEKEYTAGHELNPHWKNNGSGLPEEEPAAEDLRLPASSVGDGGYAYLKKAYLRIQEQAQREGRSMEEVAVERWGSLNKLVSMIDEAEARMHSHSKDRYRSHRNKGRSDYGKATTSSQFHKPSERRRSPSPEQTFRFQKPRDYNRDRKKMINVASSSGKRRSYHDDKTFVLEEKDDETLVPERKDDIYTQHYRGPGSEKEDQMVWERSSSSSNSQKRIPTWKKVKPKKEEEMKSHSREDSPAGNPSPRRRSPVDTRRITGNTPEEPIVIRSENDLNRLAAKYLKVKLTGDAVTASQLKAELDEARERFKAEGGEVASSTAPRGQERVMLTKMDSSGQQRPICSSREEAGFERHSGSKKQKNKYFEDTSRYSLKQMFEREKLTTVDDNIEMFLDVAAECSDRIVENENETSGISKRASQKMTHNVQEEKDISKAIRQHQKMNSVLEKCQYCLDNPNMKRHLIVSISEQVYLCIPDFQSLTEHHCLIVPKRHVPSFLALDEDEWNDVEELKSVLRRFFADRQKSLLCVETSMSFGRCPHAILECIPVPVEDGDMAPLYFKKALLESEEEWTHNIKLIDLSKKGLRRSVPKNLPYFCVTFDPAIHAGYAHVIEDEKYFPRNFGKEVIGGMMDIDYNYLYKNRRDDPLKKSKEALELTRLLDDFKDTNS